MSRKAIMTKKNGNKFAVLEQYPIMNWSWPKIIVFIPTPKALSDADNILPCFWSIAMTGAPLLAVPYGFADRVRNIAARGFLKTSFTHILMLDADHRHPANIIKRLASHVIEDPDRLIVGGLNFKREPPFTPCLTLEVEDGYASPLEWEYDEDDPLVEVTGSIGFGSVLISRKAFEQIEEPWFLHDWQNAKDDPGYKWPGHDVYFCKKAHEAGVKIYCDMSLTSLHAGSPQWVGRKTFETYRQINPIPNEEVRYAKGP